MFGYFSSTLYNPKSHNDVSHATVPAWRGWWQKILCLLSNILSLICDSCLKRFIFKGIDGVLLKETTMHSSQSFFIVQCISSVHFSIYSSPHASHSNQTRFSGHFEYTSRSVLYYIIANRTSQTSPATMPTNSTRYPGRSQAMISDRQFFVEAIIAQRYDNVGELEFLIVWAGYPLDECSWVRREDVSAASRADWLQEQRDSALRDNKLDELITDDEVFDRLGGDDYPGKSTEQPLGAPSPLTLVIQPSGNAVAAEQSPSISQSRSSGTFDGLATPEEARFAEEMLAGNSPPLRPSADDLLWLEQSLDLHFDTEAGDYFFSID